MKDNIVNLEDKIFHKTINEALERFGTPMEPHIMAIDYINHRLALYKCYRSHLDEEKEQMTFDGLMEALDFGVVSTLLFLSTLEYIGWIDVIEHRRVASEWVKYRDEF